MKIRFILLSATLLFFSQPSAAQENFNIAYGPGAQSCGGMLSVLEKQRRTDKELIENMYKVWMQGYLSALNQIAYLKFGWAADLDDANAHFRWLLNYCEENPLDIVRDACEKLLEELLLRAEE